MKKMTAILLAAILLLGLAACQTAPETETRYLVSSQTYESSFSDAVQKVVFDYTTSHAIESMTVYEDGVEVGKNTYELDENGMLAKQTTMENGEVIETMEYVYTLDGSGDPIQVEQYQNGTHYSTSVRTYTDGVLASNSTVFHLADLSTVITYDAMGNILSMEQTQGDMIFTSTYTYDENGNELTSTHTDTAGTRNSVTEYDSDGKKLKTTEYLADGSVNSCTAYTYDGLTETSTSYGGDGTCYGSTVRTLDEHGNTVTLESYDANGTLQFRQSYTYVAVEVPVE